MKRNLATYYAVSEKAGPYGRPALVLATVALACLGLCGCRTQHAAIPVIPDTAWALRASSERKSMDLSVELTVDTAIARAMAHSTEIAACRGALAVAEAEMQAATDWRDPELRLSYGQGDSTSDRHQWSEEWLVPPLVPLVEPLPAPVPVGALGDPVDPLAPVVPVDPYTMPVSADETLGTTRDSSTSYSVGLRLFPPNIWTRGPIVKAGEANLNAAKADLNHAAWKLACEVRRGFYAVHYLDSDIAIIDKEVELYAKNESSVAELVKQGRLAGADLLWFSRRRLNALSMQSRARIKGDEARQKLAELVALPGDAWRLEAIEESFPASRLGAMSDLRLEMEMAPERVDLIAHYWRRIAAEQACRVAKRELIPWFNHVQASFRDDTGATEGMDETRMLPPVTGSAVDPSPALETYTRGYRDDSSNGEEWSIDASISIPLFSFTNDRRKLLGTQLERAHMLELAAIARADREMSGSLEAAQKSEQQRTEFIRNTAPVVKSIQDVLAQALQSGLALQDVVRMQEELLENERLALEIDHAYRLAVLRVEEVHGKRLPRATDIPQ